MSEFKLTTVEDFEAATARLLETGAKVGADAWQIRAKNQTPHCKFGEQGICCRICAMGPCRITPKAPRGICGCDAHGIVGRLVLLCLDRGISLDELPLSEYKEISPVFEEDIYEAISMKTCVEKRVTLGAPGPDVMKQVIAQNKDYLKKN